MILVDVKIIKHKVISDFEVENLKDVANKNREEDSLDRVKEVDRNMVIRNFKGADFSVYGVIYRIYSGFFVLLRNDIFRD